MLEIHSLRWHSLSYQMKSVVWIHSFLLGLVKGQILRNVSHHGVALNNFINVLFWSFSLFSSPKTMQLFLTGVASEIFPIFKLPYLNFIILS